MAQISIELSDSNQQDMLTASMSVLAGANRKWFELSASQHMRVAYEGGILAVGEFVRSEQARDSFVTVTDVGIIAEVNACIVSKDTLLLMHDRTLRHAANIEGLSVEELVQDSTNDWEQRLMTAKAELGEDVTWEELRDRADEIARARKDLNDDLSSFEDALSEVSGSGIEQAEQDFDRIHEMVHTLKPASYLIEPVYLVS